MSDEKVAEVSPPTYTAAASRAADPAPAAQPAQQPAAQPAEQPAVQPAKQSDAADLAAIGKDYQARLFAECAKGNHQVTTEYGVCGIITAIACFPLGLIFLCMDSHKKCSRCGERLSE